MEPARGFDPLGVTPSKFTNSGRWVTRSGYADPALTKGDVPYDECLAANPNHTPDVVIKRASHLVYDGGLWCVPSDELECFNNLRGTDVDQTKWVSITTQRTLYGKWFADVDPKFVASMTRSERTAFLFNFARVIQKVFTEVFPEVDVSTRKEVFTIIATSVREDPPPVEPEAEDEDPYIKMGTHFYAPNIITTAHENRLIREAVLALMRTAGLGTNILLNDLDDVFDEQVYTKAGLRPVFAPKFTRCKNARRGGTGCHCGTCDGSAGGYYEKAPHQLLFVVDGASERDEEMEVRLEASCKDLIEFTEIRSDAKEVSPVFVLPSGYPKYGVGSVKRSCGKAGTSKFKFKEDANAISAMRGTKVFLDLKSDPRTEIITNMVRGFSSSGLYAKVDVIRVFTDAHTNFFVVGVDGFGAHYCSNLDSKKREHHKNTVYFVIRATGIVQKCHCKCNTVTHRLNGPCKDYESSVVPLDRKHQLVLFPGSVDTEAEAVKVSEKKIGIAHIARRFGLKKDDRDKLARLQRMAYHMRRIRMQLDQRTASGMSLHDRVNAFDRSGTE